MRGRVIEAHIRGLPLGLLALAASAATPPCSLAQPLETTKKLHVVVVAISDYSDPAWRNATEGVLRQSIEQAAVDIESFFRTNFSPEVCELHVLKTRDATNGYSLRRLLRSDLPNFGAETFTLLFLLSHGEVKKYRGRHYSEDLMIITSDTSASDPAAGALFLGADLSHTIAALPPGSTLLTFVDACHSGAALTPHLDFQAWLGDLAGLKAAVMVSTLANRESYRAFFTQALLSYWKGAAQSGCRPVDVAREWLQKEVAALQAKAGVETAPGIPAGIRYGGFACLEAFASKRGLLALYNRLPDDLDVLFESVKAPTVQSSYRVPRSVADAVNVTPVPVDRDTYRVTVRKGDQPKPVWTEVVDFNNTPVRFQPLPSDRLPTTSDSGAWGRAVERSADLAEELGVEELFVAKWRRNAADLCDLGRDVECRRRVVAALDRLGGFGPTWSLAKRIDSGEPVAWNEARSLDPFLMELLASDLRVRGSVLTAGEFYQLSAVSARNRGQRSMAGHLAYFAFMSAGDAQKASSVRKELDLEIDKVCPACKEAERAALKAPENKGWLQRLGLDRLFAFIPSFGAGDAKRP